MVKIKLEDDIAPHEKKELVLIFSALLFAGLFLNSWKYQESATNTIKANKAQIEVIEREKDFIKNELKSSKILIDQKDANILDLKKREAYYLNELKKYKNEDIKNRAFYLNSDINKRFGLFSRLAAEKSDAR